MFNAPVAIQFLPKGPPHAKPKTVLGKEVGNEVQAGDDVFVQCTGCLRRSKSGVAASVENTESTWCDTKKAVTALLSG